ncbi:MAG: ribonuclease R [Bacteroidota bacterium]
MSKDKKYKSKNKHKGSKRHDDAEYILGVIKSLGKEAGLRSLFPKVLRKMSQEEVVLALNKLEHQGRIQLEQKGRITLLEREKPHKTHHRESEYLFGVADVTLSGIAFVSVDEMDKDVFIAKKFTGNAMQGDEVKIRITSWGKRPEGQIVEIIKHAQDSFVGRVEVLEKFAFFIADEGKLNTDIFVPLDSLNGAKHQERVIVRVTDWNLDGKKPIGEVVEAVKGVGSSDMDMKMILIGNGFSIDFPRECYKELAKYSEAIPKSEIDKRLDFRDVLTFTIDPEDAKDFDDAISVRTLDNGNYEVGVHIADVSYFVREGSALDKEAERRATSVYLPDRVCPMLPEKLSNILCSLRPNEDRLTFASIFEFDQKFELQHFTIGRTVIHSKRRFTYEQAQEVIETGKGDHAEELLLLNRMSKHFREKRMKKGAIAFEKEEVKFKLDDKGKPIGIMLKVRKDAHLLVEDFMLLANETVARFGAKPDKEKKALPFVYRIHDNPDPVKLETFSAVAARFGYDIHFKDPKDAAPIFNSLLKTIIGKPEQNVLETLAIRSMAKAAYTTANIGHYGLAMEYYTHFTSPIRRYPDVLVHRLLEGILTKSDKIITKVELEARCKNSSLMERKAMDAEREAIKYKQIEFLEDKIGEEFDGIITGVIQRGVFVEMKANKCEGMVSTELLGDEDFVYEDKMVRLVGSKTGMKYQLGDAIKVKVLSADIILRRIDLGLAGEDASAKPVRHKPAFHTFPKKSKKFHR